MRDGENLRQAAATACASTVTVETSIIFKRSCNERLVDVTLESRGS